ncbi:MAG: outer membrane protein transport protein [Nitrospirae bacterium]|nr:outer membrane protein transport protein [Nitrospirota bacterium]
MAAGSSFAAGFALIEQGVSGLGNAYAGGAALAEDASTVFFNPAGMTRLSGGQFLTGGHIIAPSAKFSNEGSTHALQPVTKAPLAGGNGGDGGVTGFAPNLYATKRLNDRFTVGIGVNAPFGLATEYDNTWVGRYHAIKSEMMTININPSVAYKANEKLSLGAGISAQYIKATLSNAIDFGLLDAAGMLPGVPKGALHLVPQMADGIATMEGDSWGIGFNLGLLYEMDPNTRMGVAYRSRIKQSLSGTVDFTGAPAPLAGVFGHDTITADITLPDTLSASIARQVSPEWTVMGDVTWTNWSLFEELRVNFDSPALKPRPSVTTTDWKDNFRYSLGLTYAPKNSWTYRLGLAYDRTPIKNAQLRTPRIPDGSRTWVALGVGRKISDSMSFDVGYAHLFVSDPVIAKTPTGEDASRGGLTGTYSAHVDIISAQLTIRFK